MSFFRPVQELVMTSNFRVPESIIKLDSLMTSESLALNSTGLQNDIDAMFLLTRLTSKPILVYDESLQ